MEDLHPKFSEVEAIVLRHYADRNARNLGVSLDGPGAVTVMLDNGAEAERYYLGPVEDVLAGKLPACRGEED